MLKDVSFGQFYPTGSIIHKVDARLKLVILIAYIVFIFLSSNFYSLALCSLFLIVIIALTKIPIRIYVKNFKVILPIIVLTSLLNAIYYHEGTELLNLRLFSIYSGGLYRALFMSLRIIILILISSVLSYTATPTELTDSIESLMTPLKYIGLGTAVHTIAMMMTIALRFIPTLIEETDKIMSSQKARGADIDTGGLVKRVKALVPVIIPLLISSVRRAFELADAMESRCYNGGKGRVRMKRMKLHLKDYVSLIICICVFASVILINIFLS